jgi:hypothetical protein
MHHARRGSSGARFATEIAPEVGGEARGNAACIQFTMTAKPETEARNPPETPPEEIDPVAEASDESFPASDAPAWTTSGDGRSALKKKKKPKESS